MARGALWMVLFKAVERSLGLLSTLILARLLVPQDFGLIAMAASLIALLELFSAFGIDIALIRRNGATGDHYNTAWTLNILAGMACGMLLMAWPMSLFYDEPRLIAVVCVLALSPLLQGFENIGVVAFRKEMEFNREFNFLLSRKLASFCIGIPLAFALRSYWALVFGIVGGRAAGVVLSYLLHPLRPRLSLVAIHEFFHFSKWLVLQNLLAFLRDRSADFVVGRFASIHALGVFNVSTEIANIPGNELVAPINRAVLPAYAKLAADPPALRREYLSVLSLIALVAIPAVSGIAAVAPYVVRVLLGQNWHDAIPLLAILGFYGLTQVLQSNAYAACLALGLPKVFVRITSLHVVILLPLLIGLTHRYGVEGAAWA